ncbi:hypothetical protein [Bifidobacterium breve]|uniref:hypothetical protein n=1 Tax=Bifidobacterium breve TaxID=1685 RepID=UPI002549FAB6|nr:hypothetical protein [Bifidobacterium breve]MDK8732194.1 hypothetical protein [Bifidobacterium breve]
MRKIVSHIPGLRQTADVTVKLRKPIVAESSTGSVLVRNLFIHLTRNDDRLQVSKVEASAAARKKTSEGYLPFFGRTADFQMNKALQSEVDNAEKLVNQDCEKHEMTL